MRAVPFLLSLDVLHCLGNQQWWQEIGRVPGLCCSDCLSSFQRWPQPFSKCPEMEVEQEFAFFRFTVEQTGPERLGSGAGPLYLEATEYRG